MALFAFAFPFAQEQNLDGKQIFLNSKCNNCHTIPSVEITSKKDDATDLSNASSVGDAPLMKSYLLKEAELNDKEHKIEFKGSEEDLNTLINWLLTLKTKSEG